MRLPTLLGTIPAMLAGAALWASPASADIICPGSPAQPAKRLDVTTGPVSAMPFVEAELEGRKGRWLVDYGATASSVSNYRNVADDDPRWTDSSRTKLKLAGFSFPYSRADEFWRYDRDVRIAGVGEQAGVIGTDLLKDVVTELHYEDARDPHLLVSNGPCPAPPTSFWRISQKGYFGKNPKLRASHIPNVPVVFIELQAPDDRSGSPGPLAGARTFAQLDPGYDDNIWRYSVAVNEALFAKLDQLTPKPVKVGEIRTKNCLNADIGRPVFVVPEKHLRIEDQANLWMTKFEAFYIIRYEQENAGTCNGISTMTEPAAQLGASFLRAFGTTLFVPEVSVDANGNSLGEVWIRMPVQPPPPSPAP